MMANGPLDYGRCSGSTYCSLEKGEKGKKMICQKDQEENQQAIVHALSDLDLFRRKLRLRL